MNTEIFTDKASMTSIEIAELVGSRPDSVKRTIETLAKKGIIQFPQTVEIENKQSLGPRRFSSAYVFEGERGKRDSIIVVAQLCPEFTARLVDRWRELEEQIRKPMSQIEMVAAMALEAVRQQRRLELVEEKVSHVTETVEQIKRGTIRDGYAGYRQLVAKTGMSDAKCRNLVNAYQIPTDTHEFMTPDGLLSRRAIVAVEPFMSAFHRMMSEAEPRGTRWYHPKMGLFQALGWQG
ncbi:Rha family transcriptional regulator [Escherichia coli]|uniref:Rha family transcriptional regulator n=2 Tax=Escherichia coli TaxID=562 RepID=UPI00030DF4B5|nr:Rha family transcriptional regulator [Escherichia coli]EEQ9927258.1 DNA-binding protein [Escherichia coli O145]EFT1062964.1 DNA-binding protein [Shigella sonnei]EFW3285182.1 DNA-binding protein [Shigella flexneri]BCI49052.1 DNA-binding protein [Stx1a-converting phage Stx1_14040]BCI49216.1 DNA-binding protein [Stx1a-converting phage Stx1_14744]BCI49326.1 DNA-binding protein [Stx1a-converting phage Stx1_132418]BCI49494.1 DNA-binding protein [Stx1a-converting phage Stx1_499]BCI49606.1 DNA-b